MSDLEQRLTDALTDGAREAPSAIGLAAAARTRARERRRNRVAAGAVLAVLAVAVPTAVVARGSADGGDERAGAAGQGNTAADPNSSASDPATDWPTGGGYRWESWHDVAVRVPKTWGYGSLSDWCADGGELTPRVQRPETVSRSIKCNPGSTYGVTFQAIDNTDDFEWPVVHQDGGGWPPENYVGGRGIGGVLVMAATDDSDQARFILSTMRAIGPSGDANGCGSSSLAVVHPVGDGMSVCRYDESGELEQSELLDPHDAGTAEQAVRAAPVDARRGPACIRPHAPTTTIRMVSRSFDATATYGGSCWSDTRVTIGVDDARTLEPTVLYWALSPGWSGSVPEGVSLPSELRTD